MEFVNGGVRSESWFCLFLSNDSIAMSWRVDVAVHDNE